MKKPKRLTDEGCPECKGEKIMRQMWHGYHVETKPCPTCQAQLEEAQK